MFKIAAIQMCSSSEVASNLKAAALWIKKAAQQKAQLLVLPEMFACLGSDKFAVREPFGQGPIQTFLSTQAKTNKVWIVGGTIPIVSNDKSKAACLVFDDRGNLRAHYDKIHLFDVTLSATESYRESETTESGDRVVVFDTPFARIGLAVCYDLRFPELFRCLWSRGAELIIVPAAFTVKTGKAHWKLLARARAVENFCYFVGACQAGIHSNGRETFGHSLIVEPWGRVIAEKKQNTAGIIYAYFDRQAITSARTAIPIQDHVQAKYS